MSITQSLGKRAFPDSLLVLIVAGEASADLHGSNLVKSMKRLRPSLTFWGIGGKKMEQAGVKILFASSDMAVVGLTEVITGIRIIIRASIRLKSIIKYKRPALLILIDYPDFNLHIARIAKRYKIPVLYYISPQVWAWRSGRVKKIARLVDRMVVILPFEEAFYRQRGVKVDYVGHPLLDICPADENKDPAMVDLRAGHDYPVIGLLPGSRKAEVMSLLPVMLKSAEIIRERYPAMRCVLPLASTIEPGFVQSLISKSSVRVKVVQGNVYDALNACHAALVASGTVTLETAIMEVPMVIVYRVSPISYRVGKMMIKVPFIGLVNLVAGEAVVPELIQDEVTPERLADEVMTIIEDSDVREKMINKLKAIKRRLGRGGASDKTAGIALEMIRSSEAI